MHLALAKGHFFCQWLNPDGSHINLEGSGPGGGEMFSDEHFQSWPRQLTAADMVTGKYLRPLTHAEELAAFLEIRGHCLTDNHRFVEAREAYESAHAIAPHWSDFKNHLHSLDLHQARFRIKACLPHAI